MRLLNKYRYIFNGHPEVPEPWVPIILEMIKELDKEMRPRYIPLWFVNMLYDLSKSTVVGAYYLNSFIGDFSIDYIKQKFATLRIVGNFAQYESLITHYTNICNNTCEFCGATGTEKIMIKNWVTNVCNECQIKHKKNGSNI